MDSGWVTAAVALAVAVAGGCAWLGRRTWHVLHGAQEFLEDWKGHPQRPGVEGTPGVMARLQTVEFILGEVRTQVFPNSGGSLRDIVHRTAGDVSEIKDEQVRVRGELTKIQRERQQP